VWSAEPGIRGEDSIRFVENQDDASVLGLLEHVQQVLLSFPNVLDHNGKGDLCDSSLDLRRWPLSRPASFCQSTFWRQIAF
jgi:hypothetical protein